MGPAAAWLAAGWAALAHGDRLAAQHAADVAAWLQATTSSGDEVALELVNLRRALGQ